MKLIQIGNGSALNPLNTNSSFLVVGEKCNMLIDCGYNVYQELIKNYKKEYKDIRYIFITHMDDDHIGSLRALMYDLYFKHSVMPTLVFSVDIEKKIKKYLKNHKGLVKNYKKNDSILFSTLTIFPSYPRDYFNIKLDEIEDGWEINVFKNKHYQKGSGISFVNKHKKLGFSITGDTVPCESIEREFYEMKSIAGNKYIMFHDFSNWNCQEKQVHACKDSIEKTYQKEMIEKLKYYHNNKPLDNNIYEF